MVCLTLSCWKALIAAEWPLSSTNETPSLFSSLLPWGRVWVWLLLSVGSGLLRVKTGREEACDRGEWLLVIYSTSCSQSLAISFYFLFFIKENRYFTGLFTCSISQCLSCIDCLCTCKCACCYWVTGSGNLGFSLGLVLDLASTVFACTSSVIAFHPPHAFFYT